MAGYLSDQILKRKRIQRKGEWYPEDRLIGTVIASATLVPLSVLGMGLVTTYVEGKVGLYLDFLCLFANGIGVGISHLPVEETLAYNFASFVGGSCSQPFCCIHCGCNAYEKCGKHGSQ